VQNLIAVRKGRGSLRRGEYVRLTVEEAHGLYAFARTLGEEKTLVALNVSDKTVDVQIPVQTLWKDGQTLRSLLDNRPFTVSDGKITVSLPPWSGLYIG
jgi:glycosidase